MDLLNRNNIGKLVEGFESSGSRVPTQMPRVYSLLAMSSIITKLNGGNRNSNIVRLSVKIKILI